MASNKTVIVTGASQGIGAAVVQAFLGRSYNVVAASRSVSKAGFAPSPNLALVDGDIGQAATAANIAQTAISKFGSIDSLVNNAGLFLVKPFTDSTAEVGARSYDGRAAARSGPGPCARIRTTSCVPSAQHRKDRRRACRVAPHPQPSRVAPSCPADPATNLLRTSLSEALRSSAEPFVTAETQFV